DRGIPHEQDVSCGSRRLDSAPSESTGGVAEWLGKGLQNPVHRFNSGPRLEVDLPDRSNQGSRALSSGGERFLDAEEVRGSNPLAPTLDLPVREPAPGSCTSGGSPRGS